ncbi:MAG: 7-carboxy-7-deazaguanine synthase QueE [Acidobacteriota bacterium]
MKLAKLPTGEPEIFHTIQGEGVSVGTPSVFVRLSHCNLYCVWCDTDYTWNWRGTRYRHVRDDTPGYEKFRREEQVIELAPIEVAERVAAVDCRNVVLTGGEPLLQQRALVALMTALRARHEAYRFEIETNGTLTPSTELDTLVRRYNVSPKLANSGVELEDRRRGDALRFFAASPKAIFKLVLAEDRDLDEIGELVADLALPADRVVLMPEALDTTTLEQRQKMVVDTCLRHGYRFGDRLHLRLFGARRGT